MVATISTGTTSPDRKSVPEIPSLDIDPFSMEFLHDPHPSHALLREAGPVVRLDKWNVYTVARYAEVWAVLNDPQTFCSSRGVGLSDFAKEKPWRPPSLILEADPPAHTRTRAVLSRVLSPAVMKGIRDRFAAAAEAKVDELLAKGSFDAIADLAERLATLTTDQATAAAHAHDPVIIGSRMCSREDAPGKGSVRGVRVGFWLVSGPCARGGWRIRSRQ